MEARNKRVTNEGFHMRGNQEIGGREKTRRMKYAGFPLKALSRSNWPAQSLLTWGGNPSFISAMKNALE